MFGNSGFEDATWEVLRALMSDFMALIFLPRECHRCQNAAMPTNSTKPAIAPPMLHDGNQVALVSIMVLALVAELEEFA